MTYEEIRKSFEEAKWVMQNAEDFARRAAPFMVGRLRALGLSPDTLRQLKRELTNFDATTGRWKR